MNAPMASRAAEFLKIRIQQSDFRLLPLGKSWPRAPDRSESNLGTARTMLGCVLSRSHLQRHPIQPDAALMPTRSDPFPGTGQPPLRRLIDANLVSRPPRALR